MSQHTKSAGHTSTRPQGGSPACSTPMCIMQGADCEPELSHCLLYTYKHTDVCTDPCTHKQAPSNGSLGQLHQVFIQKRHTRQLAVRPETAYKQQKRKGKRREGGCFSRKGKEGECGREEGKAGVSSTD